MRLLLRVVSACLYDYAVAEFCPKIGSTAGLRWCRFHVSLWGPFLLLRLLLVMLILMLLLAPFLATCFSFFVKRKGNNSSHAEQRVKTQTKINRNSKNRRNTTAAAAAATPSPNTLQLAATTTTPSTSRWGKQRRSLAQNVNLCKKRYGHIVANVLATIWARGAQHSLTHLVLPQSAGSVMSHPLGDIFEVRSCGAPFSGMNMDTNWSKSASATRPRRRARCPQLATPTGSRFHCKSLGARRGHQPQSIQGMQKKNKV